MTYCSGVQQVCVTTSCCPLITILTPQVRALVEAAPVPLRHLIMMGAKVLQGGKHDKRIRGCQSRANNNGLLRFPATIPTTISFRSRQPGTPTYVFPVQLGEMTGVFESKLEQTLPIMLRLMKKMMMDKHPLYSGKVHQSQRYFFCLMSFSWLNY